MYLAFLLGNAAQRSLHLMAFWSCRFCVPRHGAVEPHAHVHGIIVYQKLSILGLVANLLYMKKWHRLAYRQEKCDLEKERVINTNSNMFPEAMIFSHDSFHY